jgi:hypothetical protein
MTNEDQHRRQANDDTQDAMIRRDAQRLANTREWMTRAATALQQGDMRQWSVFMDQAEYEAGSMSMRELTYRRGL